ncbi:MAG TPA: phosphopantetheine-binding protein, partial [Rhodocyclaceae bacterium]|nr:phosphopantetheine-binding protein [Rhodocyclaceae bacterium]
SQVASEFVPPRNFIEQNVAEIWMELMSIDRVSVSDNFFELGGHSLLLTQIASRIRDAFQVEIPLAALFDAPTVADMAYIVVQQQMKQESESDVDQLLNELQGLTEEEVRRLLEESGVKN